MKKLELKEMEHVPVGKRTRLQTTLKLRKLIKEQKRVQRDASRGWKKKRDESLANNNGIDDEEIEFLDRSEYEKRANASGSNVGIGTFANLGSFHHDDHDRDDSEEVMKSHVGSEEKGKGVIDDGFNGDNSDDSLQILGERWNPLNVDVDDSDDDQDDDDDDDDSPQVVSSDSEGKKKGNPSRKQARVVNYGERNAMSSEESSDSESSSWGDDKFIVDDHDHDHDGVNDNDDHDDGSSDSEFERRVFEGLTLPAHPKIEAKQQPDFVRRRTRSLFKPTSPRKKTGDGTVSRPVLIDVMEASSNGTESDDKEEEEEEEGSRRNHDPEGSRRNAVENGGKRKRGRPPKMVNVELQSPLKRKRVRGLKNSELQKVLLNTLSENGNASLDDLMSSMSHLCLPLKFSFRVKKSSSMEKKKNSDEDQELEDLWKEFDFALGACNIGCDSSSFDNKEEHVVPSGRSLLREKLCADGKHHLILDEEVGIRCKFCSFVKIEIKYVTPEFNKDPFGRPENRDYWRFLYGDDVTFNRFQFPDTGSYEFISGNGPFSDTQGTVWNLIPGVKSTLYPHQQEGFEFIWRNISGGIKMEELGKPTKYGLGGCIICHAPGTGKTRLTLVFLQSYMKQYPKCKPVIVAPKSVLLTWEEEFIRWKIDIPFINMKQDKLSGEEDPKVLNMLNGAKRLDLKTVRLAKMYSWMTGRGVLGLSYELFEAFAGGRKDTDEEIRQALLKQCGLLVLDEGHRPRNECSLIWKVLSNVETKRRIILSGTPFQNNFKELYNTISLVREEFVDPLLGGYQKKRGRKSNAWKRRSRMEDSRRIEKLRNRIKPFVHVYERQNLILRGLFHSVLVLKPSDLQKTCFQHIERLNFFDKDHLVSLTSVHPSLLEECEQVPNIDKSLLRKHRDDLDSGVKTRFLFELIKLSEGQGERVLVFSQRLPTLVYLGNLLKTRLHWREDIQVLNMDGQQEVKKRQQSIRLFNDPTSEARVLLASIKACCEGIHLVGASRVVLLDVAWNPSVERQAISRAYRLGQKKDVFVYHLIASGTHESDKYYRQVRKERLSELVFSPSERENMKKINTSSSSMITEDRILEEIIQHEKLKPIFEKIIHQPNADKLFESIGSLDL